MLLVCRFTQVEYPRSLRAVHPPSKYVLHDLQQPHTLVYTKLLLSHTHTRDIRHKGSSPLLRRRCSDSMLPWQTSVHCRWGFVLLPWQQTSSISTTHIQPPYRAALSVTHLKSFTSSSSVKNQHTKFCTEPVCVTQSQTNTQLRLFHEVCLGCDTNSGVDWAALDRLSQDMGWGQLFIMWTPVDKELTLALISTSGDS